MGEAFDLVRHYRNLAFPDLHEQVAIGDEGHALLPGAIAGREMRRELEIPEDEVVVCGIAIGKADPDAPANRLVPEREPVESFTTWLD